MTSDAESNPVRDAARRCLYQFPVAWLLAAVVAGILEWDQPIPSRAHLLFPLSIGHLLPYFGAVLAVACVITIAASFIARSRKRQLILSGIAALAVGPYGYSLGTTTFSGPQAQALPYRNLGIVVIIVAVSAVGAGFAWLAATHLNGGIWRQRLLGLVLLLIGAAAAGISSRVYPNEYVELHLFLGLFCLLSTTAGAREISAIRLPHGGLAIAGAVLGLAWAVASVFALSDRMDLAWAMSNHTGVSRHVAINWKQGPDQAPAGGSDPAHRQIIKPAMKRDAVAGWRKQHYAKKPHIVIFGVDGLCPTHTGAYGYTKHPTTPNVDRFAARGARFTRAYSGYPQTMNFNSSLLLGRFVPRIGGHQPPAAMQAQAMTQALKHHGYYIFVKTWFEHSSQHKFKPGDYGIDTYLPKATTAQIRGAKSMPYVPVAPRFKKLEEKLALVAKNDQPALVWLHMLGSHPLRGEFFPNEKYPFGDSRSDQYDSAVAATEAWLEELEAIVTRQLDDGRPIVWFILSDHGIDVANRGRDLYQHWVHVPLIAVGPGIEPGVLTATTDVSLDLAATIVDLVGDRVPDDYDGVSMLPLFAEGDSARQGPERMIPLSRGKRFQGAVVGDKKVLLLGRSIALFDLKQDPDEKTNIIDADSAWARSVAAATKAETRRRTRAYHTKKKP